MNIKIIHKRLQVSFNEALHLQVRDSAKGKNKPLIIFSHGFMINGLENHRLFMKIAKSLNSLGYSTLLFDYRNCGYSDGDFNDFRASKAVIDLVKVSKWGINNSTNNGKVSIISQSLGTLITIKAIEKINELVDNIVLLNLSGNNEKRYPKVFGMKILDKETFLFPKGYKVNPEMFFDIFEFNTLELIKFIKSPILFVNSGKDNIGDLDVSRKGIESSINPKNKRVIIKNANHFFSGNDQVMCHLINLIQKWQSSFLYS
ncbi:alpha/beta hydrolase [Kordia sp.]|uniref:alpha/beta hydrolase n=1 Tax=Kordia sp. TaxID=1965332 RepID=UPI003D2DFF52